MHRYALPRHLHCLILIKYNVDDSLNGMPLVHAHHSYAKDSLL